MRSLFPLALCLALVGCSSNNVLDGGAGDGGAPDGGVRDAGDGGAPDGGVRDAGVSCLAADAGSVLQPCHSSADCPCDLTCAAFGDAGTLCLQSCQQTNDCLNAASSCQGGVCLTNGCDTVGARCDAAGHQDGTCINDLGDNLCVQGGSASAACGFSASRAQADQLCPAGSYCYPHVDGTNTCIEVCNLDHSTTCSAGTACDPYASFFPGLGACFTTGQNGACVVGDGATADFFGGGTSCGSPGDQPCGCPNTCRPDPNDAGTLVCAQSCNQTSDCVDPAFKCINQVCNYNFCVVDLNGQPSSNGTTFDAPCDASATGDGSCEPVGDPTSRFYLGLCYQGGTASGSCSVLAGRDSPESLCPAKQVCLAPSANVITGQCADLCNPADGGPCLGGKQCMATDSSMPLLGVCR